MRDDVVSALVNLGYHRPLAEKAAEAAIKIIGSTSDASFERVLKQALREVAK
jgi:Holliday junction resolvasome RuvABC DNA-binding subunit